MVLYTTIQEYINYLIENQINVNIIDFVKEINKLPQRCPTSQSIINVS